MEKAFIIWLTGLPSSGKTTLANRLKEILLSRGFKVEVLDGDEVRKWLSPEAGFSREDRERHLRRVAYVSMLLARNEVVVIASFVSPYRNIREEARRLAENNGIRFIEIYVKCSLQECMRRDPKGLYQKAVEGEIKDMTGIQDVYEEPLNPEIIVDTERKTPEECIKELVNEMQKFGLI
ncbi:MAG: adenylyl-sulfate kinase [Aigarchaeota archaeon]|nr:adenylyl-sulfate kinase [Aigarchaeota archaeon]MDW7986884.1 adenylyl-sulfate kinase [Nitrososphaerota archaeon]